MKRIILIPIIICVFLFFLEPIFALESKIWTDKEIYTEGDYVKVFIQLPEEKFSSCETYLTDPSGREFQKGSGGCVAGIREFLDTRYMTEPKIDYIPSGKLTEFLSSYSEYLGENYGTWSFKVLVKRDDEVVKTLTTSFEYKYFNRIVGECNLINTKTKTCEFLGSSFEVTRDGGCGSNPVNITINYFGGEKTFNLRQGETDMLTVGLIVVRNMGSPCSADVLNLRFDKLITIEETSIKISSEENKMETELDNETKTYSLPTEEKSRIIEVKVNEEGTLKKISVEIDNTKDVLVFESNNVTAETNLPVSIEGSQLYVDSKGEKVEINILPDKALEKVRDKFDSVDNIEIKSENLMYSIKGSKNAKILGIIPTEVDIEAELDTKTGDTKNIEKPFWSFIAW